jgi:hypothetical protein
MSIQPDRLWMLDRGKKSTAAVDKGRARSFTDHLEMLDDAHTRHGGLHSPIGRRLREE